MKKTIIVRIGANCFRFKQSENISDEMFDFFIINLVCVGATGWYMDDEIELKRNGINPSEIIDTEMRF